MIIYSIQDLSNIKIIELLKKEFSKISDVNLIKNYHPDYDKFSGNLFYILANGRYKIGNYFIIEESNEYICSAGWNEYTDEIALLLTRAFVSAKYRRQYFLSKYLLPVMIEQSKQYSRLWITANEYNKTIYDAFCRLSLNKSAGLFDQWPNIYKNFVPIGVRTVYNTEQFVAEMNSCILDRCVYK